MESVSPFSILVNIPLAFLINQLQSLGVVLSPENIHHHGQLYPYMAVLPLHIQQDFLRVASQPAMYRDGVLPAQEHGSVPLPFLRHYLTCVDPPLAIPALHTREQMNHFLASLSAELIACIRHQFINQRINSGDPLLSDGSNARLFVSGIGLRRLCQYFERNNYVVPSTLRGSNELLAYYCCLVAPAQLQDIRHAFVTQPSQAEAPRSGPPTAPPTPPFLTIAYPDGVCISEEHASVPLAFILFYLRSVLDVDCDRTSHVYNILAQLPLPMQQEFRNTFTRRGMNTGLPVLCDNTDAVQFVKSVGFVNLRSYLVEHCPIPKSLRANTLLLSYYCTALSAGDLAAVRQHFSVVAPDDTPVDNDYERLKRPRTSDSTEPSFLETVPDSVRADCMAAFIDHTGSSSVHQAVCVICAQECFLAQLQSMLPGLIPNLHLLIPPRAHKSHTLFRNRFLLYHVSDEKNTVYACTDCISALRHGDVPVMALANDLWVGDIPPEIACLTLPERLLIARHLPAAYIVKMYPKQAGASNWDQSLLMDGVSGNVSSYPLPTAAVAQFVDGTDRRIFPPPSTILSSLISVTFIKPNKKIQYPFPANLCVSRERVFQALTWLEKNNPLYYNIHISQENLEMLPHGGIPKEILLTSHVSYDMATLGRERAGYVPEDEAEDESASEDVLHPHHGMFGDADIELEPIIADIPLQSYGLVDVEGNNVQDADLIAHGLQNSLDTALFRNDTAKIRRSSAFVNEYGRVGPDGLRTDGGPSNPNHLLGSFPWLFPYGLGGYEVARRFDVTYETHARWSMRYADHRFRKDSQFVFQVFGVIQKRKICRAAAIHIKQPHFRAHEQLLTTLQPKDLSKAEVEENRHIKFSNPAVQALRTHITSVRAKVPATDESRRSIRSKIWSTNIMFNPPSLWLTINPTDQHDPIAQVLAGSEIDLDAFVASAGPDHTTRARHIVSDAYSSAHFFHFLIRALLEHLFGISVGFGQGGRRIKRKKGIFGTINAYIGTVEAQGRGSLHLHLLLWMSGSLTAEEMMQALKSEAFRQTVETFISTHIHADFGCNTVSELRAIPKTRDVAYSRPLDPRSATYVHDMRHRLVLIGRTVQVHECNARRCLVKRCGKIVCKRRAPFPLSEKAWIDEQGNWGPRRIYGYVNNFSPDLLNATRSNHDIKILLHAPDTANISWYITTYTAKKQSHSSNTSALLARSLAFQRKSPQATEMQTYNRQLIQRCSLTLGRTQEFSAAEVFSYLMGWGDRYISHSYVPFRLNHIISALKETFPTLAPHLGQTDNSVPGVELRFVEGTLCKVDVLSEYADRGAELTDFNFFTFMLDTYDDKIPNEGANTHSIRVRYRPGSKRDTRCRVIRQQGHEMLPNFIGGWFPRPDRPESIELYSATILLLFKPWRSLSDITATFDRPSQALPAFLHVNPQVRRYVNNINYYHACYDGAQSSVQSFTAIDTIPAHIRPTIELDDDDADAMSDGDLYGSLHGDEDEITLARMTRIPRDEAYFAEQTMMAAERVGLFQESTDFVGNLVVARTASDTEVLTFMELYSTLQKLLDETNFLDGSLDTGSLDLGATQQDTQSNGAVDLELSVSHEASRRPLFTKLNADQRFAHDLVATHLEQTLSGSPAPQLLMMVLGSGGTGKTVMINALKESFGHQKLAKQLVTTATSGVAATLTGGCTIHSWAGLSIQYKGDPSKTSKTSAQKRAKNMKGVTYLVLDEISMLKKKDFSQLHDHMNNTKQQLGETFVDKPFGGINVILCGDFHQFPPVGASNAALYCRTHSDDESSRGYQLYQQFTTVARLDTQVRVKDAQWMAMLENLRHGNCDAGQIEMVKDLVLGGVKCPQTDLHDPNWSQAILITPRNSSRHRWNEARVHEHAAQTGNYIYRVHSEDRKGRERAALSYHERLHIAGMKESSTKPLLDCLDLCIGMAVMVTVNISTETDLANGTRGFLENLILDPRDRSVVPVDNIIHLSYPPVLVHFRPLLPPGTENTVPSFAGIPQGLIPIIPSECSFPATIKGRKLTIHRRQLALTAAYAFTHHKGQGQTLGYMIVDIAHPPRGKLDAFSVYVALSRSKGRDTIRILRDFDYSVLTMAPPPDLVTEDIRLNQLVRETKTKYSCSTD